MFSGYYQLILLVAELLLTFVLDPDSSSLLESNKDVIKAIKNDINGAFTIINLFYDMFE